MEILVLCIGTHRVRDLIQGVGMSSHVLRTRKIEGTNESVEVVIVEALVEMFN